MVRKVKKIRVNVPHTVMKQSVNVRVNVPDKVRRRRTKRPAGFSGRGGGSSSGSVASLPTPIHAFTPVYIQSGQAPSAPESNPLLRYIQDIHHNVMNKHEEHLANGLLKQVDKPKVSVTNKGSQTTGSQSDTTDIIPPSTPAKTIDDWGYDDVYGINPMSRRRVHQTPADDEYQSAPEHASPLRMPIARPRVIRPVVNGPGIPPYGGVGRKSNARKAWEAEQPK